MLGLSLPVCSRYDRSDGASDPHLLLPPCCTWMFLAGRFAENLIRLVAGRCGTQKYGIIVLLHSRVCGGERSSWLIKDMYELFFVVVLLVDGDRSSRSGARSSLSKATATASSEALPTSWKDGRKITPLYERRWGGGQHSHSSSWT